MKSAFSYQKAAPEADSNRLIVWRDYKSLEQDLGAQIQTYALAIWN